VTSSPCVTGRVKSKMRGVSILFAKLAECNNLEFGNWNPQVLIAILSFKSELKRQETLKKERKSNLASDNDSVGLVLGHGPPFQRPLVVSLTSCLYHHHNLSIRSPTQQLRTYNQGAGSRSQPPSGWSHTGSLASGT